MLFLSTQRGWAEATKDAAAELQDLIGKVQAKLKAGQHTETELAADLKGFDDLLAEHKGEKTDAVAQVLFMKAMLYLQVLDDNDKGVELIQQLKRDFPGTKSIAAADQTLEMLKKQEDAKKIQSLLVENSKFPGFEEKDVEGKPLSIDNYKGKVVLIDFWATWCGPCVAELPNVLKTYEKHHAKGFEIIGISLDQDEAKLSAFTKQKKMTWQQFFDGQGWGNKLAVKYGINSIPATFLLDGEGKIIGKDVRGEALEAAVTKALGAN
jgi:thiol-disulfide isomerase/thioredoxin